jgi:hypothetical protein
LGALREAEDWLENDGDSAKYSDYQSKFSELNGKFLKLKMRKEEYGLRDNAVEQARNKISNYQDKVDSIQVKKPWISEANKTDIYERMNETVAWLEEQVNKQKSIALDEDPAFKVSEIDLRLKRVDSLFTRLNNLPKPKEAKKPKKMPKNIKIENMTFDGSSDINMDDFIQYGSADDEDESGDSYQ